MRGDDVQRRLPWGLLLAATGLLGLGLAAIARAEYLAADPPRLAARQLVFALLALGLGTAAAALPYRRLAHWAYPALGLTLALLLAVYATAPINGARRWFALGPVSFQPSELAKLVYVVALARYLMYRENQRTLVGFLAPLVLTLIPVLAVLRQPDLGTSLVFFPVLAAMLWAAGARLGHLTALAACGLLILPILWWQMSPEQRSRVTALAEQNPPETLPTADGYHLHQAQLVRAQGGVWGSWWLDNELEDRAVYHLPAAATDFVFAVIGERFGLAGSLVVLGMYAVLVASLVNVARATREPFGRLIAVGVAALFGTEALINTAMTAGLAPVTGLSLPLVSYGGSGLVIHALALGAATSVALRPGYELTGEPFAFAARRSIPGAARGWARRSPAG